MSETDKHNIGLRLKSLRKQAGFTMDGLARAIGLKGASSYQRYENPKNYWRKEYLPFDLAVRIGEVLDGKGVSPVQYNEVLLLSGFDRLTEHSLTSTQTSAFPLAPGNAQGRSPEQIFTHHKTAIESGDLYAIMTDYDEESVIISHEKTYRGLKAIEEYFAQFLKTCSGGKWDFKTKFEGDVLLASWRAEWSNGGSKTGSDTFFFRNGLIGIQTIGEYESH